MQRGMQRKIRRERRRGPRSPARVALLAAAAALAPAFFLAPFPAPFFAGADKAAAHDAHYGLTSIEWNAATRMIEVIHRHHAHHVLDAIAAMTGSPSAGFDAPQDRAAFASYLEETFALRAPGGEAVTLTLVGAELEGDFFIIYQEAGPMDEPAGLHVRNDFLADIFRSQTNHVNLSWGGGSDTLVFAADHRGVFLAAEPKADAAAGRTP